LFAANCALASQHASETSLSLFHRAAALPAIAHTARILA